MVCCKEEGASGVWRDVKRYWTNFSASARSFGRDDSTVLSDGRGVERRELFRTLNAFLNAEKAV